MTGEQHRVKRRRSPSTWVAGAGAERAAGERAHAPEPTACEPGGEGSGVTRSGASGHCATLRSPLPQPPKLKKARTVRLPQAPGAATQSHRLTNQERRGWLGQESGERSERTDAPERTACELGEECSGVTGSGASGHSATPHSLLPQPPKLKKARTVRLPQPHARTLTQSHTPSNAKRRGWLGQEPRERSEQADAPERTACELRVERSGITRSGASGRLTPPYCPSHPSHTGSDGTSAPATRPLWGIRSLALPTAPATHVEEESDGVDCPSHPPARARDCQTAWVAGAGVERAKRASGCPRTDGVRTRGSTVRASLVLGHPVG